MSQHHLIHCVPPNFAKPPFSYIKLPNIDGYVSGPLIYFSLLPQTLHINYTISIILDNWQEKVQHLVLNSIDNVGVPF